jgi:hypothetical protein
LFEFLKKITTREKEFKYGKIVIRDKIISLDGFIQQTSNISTLFISEKKFPIAVVIFALIGIFFLFGPFANFVLGVVCLLGAAAVYFQYYTSKNRFLFRMTMNSGNDLIVPSNNLNLLKSLLTTISAAIENGGEINQTFVINKSESYVTNNIDKSRHQTISGNTMGTANFGDVAKNISKDIEDL